MNFKIDQLLLNSNQFFYKCTSDLLFNAFKNWFQ